VVCSIFDGRRLDGSELGAPARLPVGEDGIVVQHLRAVVVELWGELEA